MPDEELRALAGGNFRNTVSLDQLMARHRDGETRFRSLVLNTKTETSPCIGGTRNNLAQGSMAEGQNSSGPDHHFCKPPSNPSPNSVPGAPTLADPNSGPSPA